MKPSDLIAQGNSENRFLPIYRRLLTSEERLPANFYEFINDDEIRECFQYALAYHQLIEQDFYILDYDEILEKFKLNTFFVKKFANNKNELYSFILNKPFNKNLPFADMEYLRIYIKRLFHHEGITKDNVNRESFRATLNKYDQWELFYRVFNKSYELAGEELFGDKFIFSETSKSVRIYKDIMNGSLKRFPKGYMDAITDYDLEQLCKYVIEEQLQLTPEQAIEVLDKPMLESVKAYEPIIRKKFKGEGIYGMLKMVYGHKFKEWQIGKGKKHYWTKERVKQAYMDIFTMEEVNVNNVSDSLVRELSVKYGLTAAFHVYYGGSAAQVIEDVFNVNRIDLLSARVKRGYWTRDNAIKEFKRLFEEKLKWTDDDFIKNYSSKVIRDNGLFSPMDKHFNASPFQYLNTVYPDRFKKEQLKQWRGFTKLKR